VDQVSGLSLEQAIERALAQEPRLGAVRAQIDVTRGMRLQAGLRPNPSISFERREAPAGTDNLTTVGVQWPLELFRRAARVAVADREVAAAEQSVRDAERLLAAEVRTRYGELLVAVRDLTLIDELVAATGRQYALLRSRVDEGASPRLDRDLIDVERRRLESQRLIQSGRAEAAMIELRRMLGMSPEAPLTVSQSIEALAEGPHPAADDGAAAGARAEPAELRSDVRAAAARLAAAEARIDRAKNEGRVDVSLFGSYMRMDSAFPQRAFAADGTLEPVRGLFHYVSAGAMVTIPLLNRNQGELEAARAEQRGAEAAHEAARLAARSEVAAARARDTHAQQAAQLFGGEVRALARQNLTVVRQSYELGRVTVFDVLAEQRRYLEVERAYTETLATAFEARAALKRALGDLR
jgi:cobalt-zinc-cadmium efflux system outer membrane protein